MKSIVLVLLISFGLPLQAKDPYSFSYKNKNDMRGAWLMCATTGFTEGDCPKVFERCWVPPMIYLKRSGLKVRVKSHCTKLPNFVWNDSDTDQALKAGYQRVQPSQSVEVQELIANGIPENTEIDVPVAP